MKQNLWQIIKLCLFVLIILILQTSIIKEISSINFNLPLIAIICIASFSSLEISLYSAAMFMAATSLLSYNSSLYWGYLVLAFITNQLNPKNLEDKFIIAAFYCTLSSPILELIYSTATRNLISKCIIATLINLATLVPLYFITKMILAPRKRILY